MITNGKCLNCGSNEIVKGFLLLVRRKLIASLMSPWGREGEDNQGDGERKVARQYKVDR